MNSRPVPPLRLLRVTRGLRLADVRRETGIPEAMLSQVERGKKPISRRAAECLSTFYGVEIAPGPNSR